jgi:putative ABC transport system ATP-binding protein
MLLQVQNISKSFETAEGPLEVLRDVSLNLEAGQSLALTGESGSGKSTLLHLIGGLDVPSRGRIFVSGTDIAGLGDGERAALRRGTLGLVFQQYNLIPSLDVTSNLSFHARLAGTHDAVWMRTLVDRLGLDNLLKRFPEQLSGGQQQRVAIGRALAGRPKLVLADEPTGNLDEATGDAVLDLMLELVAERGVSLLMVTHSPRLAQRLDARVHLRGGSIS